MWGSHTPYELMCQNSLSVGVQSSAKVKNSPPMHENDSSKKESRSEDWYIAGGSSGGSAVAVATGSCFA